MTHVLHNADLISTLGRGEETIPLNHHYYISRAEPSCRRHRNRGDATGTFALKKGSVVG